MYNLFLAAIKGSWIFALRKLWTFFNDVNADLVTGAAAHAILAHALSVLLVAERRGAGLVLRAAQVAAAVLATQQLVGGQPEEAVLANQR